jgi:hypothetical protein
MALPGRAFLALFNDFDPARDAEYNEWHSREHVPERLSVPGMSRARRYVNRADPQFPYFTLYEMDSAAVMQSQPYLHLLDHPSPWSAQMRPGFRRFLRIPCRGLASAGDGLAGRLATFVLEGEALAEEAAWATLCQRIERLPGLVGAHVGQQDPALRGPAVAAAQAPATVPTFVLLVEAQERQALARHRPAIEAWLPAGLRVAACREYELMHALTEGRPAR